MPVALRQDGFKFFFYSNEGDPREPPHIHVRRGGDEAKFWLVPSVELARNDGFDARTLRRLARTVHKQRPYLLRTWYEHFP